MTRPSWAQLPNPPRRKTITIDVRAPNGRRWTVERTAEWVTPTGSQSFDLDETGGRGGRIVIGGALILFWLVLAVVWWPSKVHVPAYFVWAAVGVLALVPLSWWSRRPWSVIVDAPGFGEDVAVHAVAVLRGRRAAARYATALAQRLTLTGRLEDPEEVAAPVVAVDEQRPPEWG